MRLRSAAPVLLLLVLAGCGASPGSTATAPPPTATPSIEPGPSASPAPTVAPTDAPPTEAPSQPAADLAADAYARVVTNDLRVRSKPGVGAGSQQLEPLLDDGTQLFVIAGPTPADGYDWYLVEPIVGFEGSALPSGWVAAADKNGEQWIASDAVSCPETPSDVESLALLNETERDYFEVTCFGGTPISFEARLGSPEAQCGIEVPFGTDPTWFDPCQQDGHFLVPADGSTEVALFSAWEPGVDLSLAPEPGASPSSWPVVQVTGTYDHEAARTCTSRQNYVEAGVEAPEPARVVLECRTRFVVTAIEPAG